LASFGAWSVVIALEKTSNTTDETEVEDTQRGLAIQNYAGLGHKQPLLAAAMAVFMLSFTGIPPTLGFVGKFYLFRAVLEAGFVGLALVGVLTSLVSAYYYLRIVVAMYMQEGKPLVFAEPWIKATAASAALATVLLSIFAAPLIRWASQAVLLWN